MTAIQILLAAMLAVAIAIRATRRATRRVHEAHHEALEHYEPTRPWRIIPNEEQTDAR